MIIQNQEIRNIEDNKMMDSLLNTLIEQAQKLKCIEIYDSHNNLLYFTGNESRHCHFTYGYNNDFESTCDVVTITMNGDLEFIEDGDFTTIRIFDTSDIVKVYIGDTWSN